MKEGTTPRWLLLALAAASGLTILFAVLFAWALLRPVATETGDEKETETVATVDVEATVVAMVAATGAAADAAVEAVGPTPDLLATVLAAVDATVAALPTATPQPTNTPAPTATATPNLTATALADCSVDVTLVEYHTYRDPRFQSAPVGATFPVNFTLANAGSCLWPAGWQFAYESGEDFGGVAPVALTANVLPGAEVVLTAPGWSAPDEAQRLETSWQLQDETGTGVGPVITFDILIYLPPTATPPGPTPTATGEPVEVTELGFNVFPNNDCEYPGNGSEWRCAMLITPYGGGGGPYTIWVFDGANGQPVEYFGGNQTHYISGRRCAPWVHEIRIQDEVTGTAMSQDIFVSPLNMSFAVEGGGGCTEPD